MATTEEHEASALRLDAKVDSIIAKLDSMAAKMDRGFAAILRRLDDMQARRAQDDADGRG